MPSYYGIVELPAGSSIRLDRYVAETLKLLTRSQIKARCLGARVNGTQVKISRILMGGENLELSWEEAPPSLLVPEDIPLKVLYEDERVIVVNKRQGMVVHPAAGNRSGTLMNALLARRIRSSGVGGQISDFRFQISDFRGGCQASVAGGELPRGGCQAVGVGERAFIVHR
ncbi:MAG: hypothetical protein LBD20_06650, partial [Spirochaetaceae bacterium]|nr:hypothetical protein [Spirochaetaceae bacterium]